MFECDTCYREFVNAYAAEQHMNALNHWNQDHSPSLQDGYYSDDDDPGFECEACMAVFDSFAKARQHMDAYNHWRQHWCNSCEKGFQNENNLRQHLNSKIHRGSNMLCPFCNRSFATATGLVHHLEAGSCPQARGVNHATILEQIRRVDPHHVLTKKLLTYPSSTPNHTTATSATWNGYGFECYMCHREFGGLGALNQHVNSPAHRQKVYHCPGRACSKEFTALAGLFNHLESEVCGSVRFEAVQRNVGNFLNGRMISFR
ncbi:hypothetical protein PMIN06_007053 [Paraphaeosphaeria minitans]|uniref:C2H2-type domain-containing protein n=1 Tax=Paraphaeosphaeria minitans TaxID=565426 RepID=A0A9P6GSC6_9PLEO|nr:hypothetical protein PMIN01_02885 [Paraphaeosphaeria minitans]